MCLEILIAAYKNTSESLINALLLSFTCFIAEVHVMMAPVIEELSEKFKGKIFFAKVNVDDNQKLSQKFKVMSIPTLVIFKKGEEAGRIIGSLQADALEERIKKIVG